VFGGGEDHGEQNRRIKGAVDGMGSGRGPVSLPGWRRLIWEALCGVAGHLATAITSMPARKKVRQIWAINYLANQPKSARLKTA
jgi:hypothetical protein